MASPDYAVESSGWPAVELDRRSPVRCVVADDSPAVLTLLPRFLREFGVEVVGLARHEDEALAAVASARPEVVLLDLGRPGIGIAAVAARVVAASPESGVVFYAEIGNPEQVTEGLSAGVRGFVSKTASLDEILRAVQLVAEGGTYIDPSLGASLLKPDSAATRRITEREREVLQLLADGLTGEEIARRLSISVETMRTHLGRACGKLDADTRTHAVAKALRECLIR